MLDVSVIVCARDARESIVTCLESLQRQHVREIILVDGGSSDGTVELALPYVTRILHDPGCGLALARNIGLRAANATYIAFVGPDNVLPEGALASMQEALKRNGLSGVSACTRLMPPASSYLQFAMDRYKSWRYFPGERAVIGTPTIFNRSVLGNYQFDPKMTWSDDSDLCTRMAGEGHRFAIIPTIVYEVAQDRWPSVFKRWLSYGRSDREYYAKYANEWTLGRRRQSILHPLRAEVLDPLQQARSLWEALLVFPFLIFLCALRYAGWVGSRARHADGSARA
jgi:glycosyltransferase involved in cell wall biosynthesis